MSKPEYDGVVVGTMDDGRVLVNDSRVTDPRTLAMGDLIQRVDDFMTADGAPEMTARFSRDSGATWLTMTIRITR